MATLAACGWNSSTPDPYAALQDSVGDYLGPFKGGGNVEVYKGEGKPQGRLDGPVVLIDAKAKSVSEYQSELPRALRADKPDDVVAAVIIRESWRSVGEYSGGEPAMQTVWRVTVVDLGLGKIVGKAVLGGDHPPVVADISAGENYGDPPWEELRAYLRKLSRN